MKSDISKVVASIGKYFTLIVFVLITLYPFYWVVMSSFKSNEEIYVGSPFSIPKKWKYENYISAFTQASIPTYLKNSIIISFSAVFLSTFVSSLAAYSLARIRSNFPMYTYFTIGIMIPVHSLIIPSFVLLHKFGLHNSQIGLIILYFVGAISVSVFILTAFMKGIPIDLEDAARIDGCNRLGVFFRIILPLSKAGLATVSTLSFLRSWNDFLFAYIVISKPHLKTITQGIMELRGEYVTDFGLLSAGLVAAILPVFIIYLIFQEQIITGMVAGAVKG
jgi:raffinose/stachyose/melibiose transport system permease protein